MAADLKTNAFLAALKESNLLDDAQLEAIGKEPLAQADDARPLAKELVNRKLLTSFQANQILQGQVKSLVVGPYRVLDRLGEGGMGQVFKARHQTMARIVALKVMRKEKLANQSAVQRFYREVQAAAQLIHPNIVIAYNADQVDNTHYFAMEYVDGSDLSKIVKQSGPLPIPQACDYIRQAALALQHAHECGLVHRDIKPANLLVALPSEGKGGTGVVKILDMGLARLQEGHDQQQTNLTRVGTVLGTPEYMAPEQAVNSSTVDIRADLYSLGCTLFYLLTGHPPYRGSALMEVLLMHRNDPLPVLSEHRPEAPAPLRVILDKLLAKHPEDRYASPAELVSALSPLCPGAGSDAWIAPPEMRTELAGIDFGPVKESPTTPAPFSSPTLEASQAKPAAKATMKPSTPPAGPRPVPGETAAKTSGKKAPKKERASSGASLKLAAGAGALVLVAVVVLAGVIYVNKSKQKPNNDSNHDVAQLNGKDHSNPLSTSIDPKPEITPEPKPKVEPEPRSKPEPKPEPKTEPITEPKPEPKAEPKAKSEPKPEPKPEAKPEPKPEPKAEPAKAPKKLPIPADALQADFLGKLKQEHKDEYASKRPTDHLALATAFLEQSEKVKDRPVERFVLLREASELAAQSGNIEPALQAIDKLDDDFEINELELKSKAMEKAIKVATLPAALKPILAHGRELAEEAIAADQYESAVRFLGPAEKAAYGLKLPIAGQIAVRKKEAVDMQEDYKDVKKANEVLAKSPEDARASLTVGKFLCLHKGNWDDGLPLVAAGNDVNLKALSEKDMEDPKAAADRVKLGDAWCALGEKEKRPGPKKQLFKRARHWYEQAVAELTDAKTKGAVETKLRAIEKVAPKEEAVAEGAPRDTVTATTRSTSNPEFDKKFAAGQKMLGAGYFDRAAELLSDAVNLAPDDKTKQKAATLLTFAQHMERGWNLITLRPRDAIEEFQSALQIFPNNPSALNGLQMSLRQLGGRGMGNPRKKGG